MTLKHYLWTMLALSAVCWGIFAFVVGLVDPSSTNWLGFILFYASLAASLIGTFAVAGFLARFLFSKEEIVFNIVKNSFRQSFLISLFVISLLILKSTDLFNWLNLILLAVIFTVIEISLTARKNK